MRHIRRATMVMAVLAFLEGTKRGICRSVGKEEEEEE